MPVELKVPEVGESVTEVYIGEWHKSVGDRVERDEDLVELESEKATFDAPAPASGRLARILKQTGETAAIGEVIAYIEEDGAETEAPEGTEQKPAGKASRKEGDGKGKMHVKPKPAREEEPAPKKAKEKDGEEPKRAAERIQAPPEEGLAAREEEVVPLSPLRRRIAERLVAAQRDAALLTTFNEIDMSAVRKLREQLGDAFKEKHGVKLGFMSFFVKAAVDALRQFPQLNAEIRDDSIVYRNYYDIGIAIGGGKGLVVPVLRNAERLSFAEIEKQIADFAARARRNALEVEELRGGTFTISNGGIYGSLLSTPIVNPPQSGVLGMHAIQDRPVVVAGEFAIRPMMYVALTYDHRLVDGREAVTFLKRIKEAVEEPSRMLLEV